VGRITRSITVVMGNTNKTVIIIFIFICLVPFFAFSDSIKEFRMSHAVNTPVEYSFEFREYNENLEATTEKITNVNLDSTGQHFIASLVLTFNRNVQFKAINVDFTDLVNVEDNTKYFPYEMEIMVPGSRTEHLVEVEEYANSHGSGVARLISGVKNFLRTNTDATEDNRIADFAITIADDQSKKGTYSATMTLVFEAN